MAGRGGGMAGRVGMRWPRVLPGEDVVAGRVIF